MDTFNTISNKIVSLTDIESLEILISVKSALLDLMECPILLLNDSDNINHLLNNLDSYSYTKYKSINDKNLRKLNTNFQEIFLLPKNKKLRLLSLIDSILQNLNDNIIIVFDNISINPFLEDSLFNYLQKCENVDTKIIETYYNRNKSANFLKNKYMSNNLYFSCHELAIQNKIISHWKKSWHKIENYSQSNSSIESLLIL